MLFIFQGYQIQNMNSIVIAGSRFNNMRKSVKTKKSIDWGSAKQTQSSCITFIQRRPSVSEVGPIMYKYYIYVLYLQGVVIMNVYTI